MESSDVGYPVIGVADERGEMKSIDKKLSDERSDEDLAK